MMARKVAVAVLVCILTGIAFAPISSAASGFQAGDIIDNRIFTNTNTMSVNDIQNFLNSKVPTCDSNHTGSTGSTGTVYNPPFVCLKSFYENPNSTYTVSFSYVDTSGNTQTGSRTYYYNNAYRYTSLTPVYNSVSSGQPYYANGYTLKATIQNVSSIPSGAISAAQIIYNNAQQYQINPQVLIVLLQKEQGLVTDTWPEPWEYQSATGYGCPDYSPCYAGYSGFSNQIKWAAVMFHSIMTQDPNWYSPYIVGTNFIQWNPNTSCGGSNVSVQNLATAALYDYTPYQPNSYALNGGTSTAYPYCGAFGNLNFYFYFTSWFGQTTGPEYGFVSAVSPLPTVTPNSVVTGVQIKITNESGTTWYSDGNVPAGGHPTRLAMPGYAANPYANTADPVWLGTNNQIKMDQASVASGSDATFTFSLKAPYKAISSYVMQMVPVLDGVGFYPNIGMRWTLSTPTPNPSFQIASDSGIPASTASGTSTSVTIIAKNTGNTVWYGDSGTQPIGSNTTRLYTVSPGYHASPFYDGSTWLANNQIKLQQWSVNPGDTGTFTFNAITPSGAGLVADKFGLIINGVTPMNGSPAQLSTSINDYQYQSVSSSLPSSLDQGQVTMAKIFLKNTGTQTWYADGSVPTGGHAFRLATPGYSSDPLATSDPAWLGTSNQIKMVTSSVAPGQTGEFDIPLAAPYNAGQFTQTFMPVLDGKFFLGGAVSAPTSVSSLSGTYSTVSPSVGPPAVMSKGQAVNVKLYVKNSTNTTWYADGNIPSNFNGGATRIVMYRPYYRNSVFAPSSDPAWLGTSNQIKMVTSSVAPGQTGEFDFTWQAPQASGTYTEPFTLVFDGYHFLPYVGMQFVTTVQ